MADPVLCSVPECCKPARARGWCKLHWKRWRQHGDPNAGAYRPLDCRCSVAGCDRTPKRWWKKKLTVCDLHWRRLYSTGTAQIREDKFSSWVQCSVDGCDKDARSPKSGMCEMHYYRLRRNGAADLQIQLRAPVVTSHGYVIVPAHGHVVAQSNGMAYEHRKVLYDAIGIGPHQCHWCKGDIEWMATGPHKLVVDHLDGDKSNNNRGNLVPSCHKCNSTRGLFQVWVTKHKDDPFLWALYLNARAA